MSEKNVRVREMGMSMGMCESTLVEQARTWVEGLCKDEERGRADFVGAMERVAIRLRLPFGFLRDLVYRPPKRISAGRFLILAKAHDDLLASKSTKSEDYVFTASTQLGRTLLSIADALDRKADQIDR